MDNQVSMYYPVHVLEHFKLVNLHITLQLQGDCSLPAYKGSMWHGWLGHAIRQTSESAFFTLYQQHDHEQPKPYAIEPGADHKTEWRQGELIQFDLKLFGAACALMPVIKSALRNGEDLGLGEARTKIRIVAISAVGPFGSVLENQSFTLADYWQAATKPETQLTLVLNTPLRIKHQGKILHNPPQLTATVLAAQARRRLMQLTKYWVTDDQEILAALSQHDLGDKCCSVEPRLYFEDWQRFSLKQQAFIPFGGFKGYLCVKGKLSQLYFWLFLGELLQLGGKTTFGLGCYKLYGLEVAKLT